MSRRAIAGAVLLICAFASATLHAQASNESLLLLRVLAYDRNVSKRAGGKTVTIAVVYKPGDSESESMRSQIANALSEAAKKVTVAGLPVKVVSVAVTANLDSDLAGMRPAAAYVCPGLQDAVPSISRVTRSRSILSFAGTEKYITSGLSIGLVRRSAKSAITVNLPSSKAEGAALDAALLRVADVKK